MSTSDAFRKDFISLLITHVFDIAHRTCCHELLLADLQPLSVHAQHPLPKACLSLWSVGIIAHKMYLGAIDNKTDYFVD